MATLARGGEALAALEAAGIIPILRAGTGEHLVPVGATLAEAGAACLEVTLTTPGALASLPTLIASCPGALVGVGSVLDGRAAADAVAAGAAFLVTPTVVPAAIASARRHGVPILAGAATPTEIQAAHALGATAVKVFPVGALGGAAYVRAVRGPLPDIPLVPTGGVRIEDIPDYLGAGSRAVGLGSELIGDALHGGDLDELADRALRALAAVATARRGAG